MKVVLYNPRASFYTMPLALVAVGSALDRQRHEVRILDGRLERDPIARAIQETERALCFGVSVLTGRPIRDALSVTRAVKAAHPDVPVIWGGWHPSLFPAECLAEPSIDAVVIGQGEETFREIVSRLAWGNTLDGCAGAAWRRDGRVVVNAARPLADLNTLPPHAYDLLDVERYFALKGRRQIDYASSQGCRFRCSFCADPHVYRRGWTGLKPGRVAGEVAELAQRYRADEIAFQDETFFTSPARIDALCEQFTARGVEVSWTATMRADQACRLSEEQFARARRAGLRRVMIGVESGSDRMLAWMKKDVTVQQIVTSAERCARHDLGAIFNFIVGFPGEPEACLEETLALVKRIRAMHPAFEASIFYYRPYPGSEIAEAARQSGYEFPRGLDAWADFDFIGDRSPWLTADQWRRIERFKFYVRHAWDSGRWRWPLRTMSRWRCARDFYAFPVEKGLVELVRPPAPVS
jgi:anaerobic magnesium-protoporphyrin IX monomethyl ester cyclase